jgi:hypothetical protein
MSCVTLVSVVYLHYMLTLFHYFGIYCICSLESECEPGIGSEPTVDQWECCGGGGECGADSLARGTWGQDKGLEKR